MSVQRFARIVCDGCGRIGTGIMRTSTEARKHVKLQGWRHTPRRSYEAGGSPTRDECPGCVAGTSPSHRWERAVVNFEGHYDKKVYSEYQRCAVCYQKLDVITGTQRCPGTSHRAIVGKDW